MLKDEITRLEKSSDYAKFKKENPSAYLAHAFIMLDGTERTEWQLGYYLEKEDSLVTFFMKETIKKSPASEIFKKDKQPLLPLDIKTVSHSLDDALKKANEFVSKEYKGEIVTKTIILIQDLGDKTIFNITMVTKAFNTLNIKLSADSLELKSHEKRSILDLGKKDV